MGHFSSRFDTLIVHLMTLINWDYDMETNDVIIRRIINLGRTCEEVADPTNCNSAKFRYGR